jgi:tartrate dehydrogenase/decarboxylase/D-malate dehydrogenase
MKKTHRIAVIPGDGIGTEVMPEGVRVLEAAASRFGIGLEFDHFDFACWPYFERHGSMMPDDWQARIGGHDAILFGAVGWPEKIPTTSRSGGRSSSSGATSTSTPTCARRA